MRKSEKSEDQKMEQWFGPDSKISPPTTGTQGSQEHKMAFTATDRGGEKERKFKWPQICMKKK